MIEPIDWTQRLHDAVAETLRKREARREERQELKTRRDAGLRARHAQKLARGRGSEGEPVPEPPPCCAGLDEPCPQHRQAAREARHQGPRPRSGRRSTVIGESGKARPAPPEDGAA